ncbi:MAG: hypothetical protein P4M05_33465 [Bradyrhizobium sp.]|nr:hypothetical protein [Bradyrhizobium sp.]
MVLYRKDPAQYVAELPLKMSSHFYERRPSKNYRHGSPDGRMPDRNASGAHG